jgi:hypothetical protein
MESTSEHEYKGELETCAHRVVFRYWGFKHPLTSELEQELTEEAESRAKACIVEGYRSGDLNCCYHTQQDGSDDEEIRGWWEITTD